MSTRPFSIPQEVLTENLKCPVCWDIPVPPITLCIKGHLICGMCRGSVKECGICRSHFTETRNFAVEALVGGLEIECKNALCQTKVTVAGLEQHLKICEHEYRPVTYRCIDYDNCKTTFSKLEQFRDHLIDSHKARLAFLSRGWSLTCCRIYWKVNEDLDPLNNGTDIGHPTWTEIFTCFTTGTEFYLNSTRKHGQVFWWITSLLSNTQAAQYSVHFHIMKDSRFLHRGGGHSYCMRTLQISSFDKTLDEIRDTEYCVSFPVQTLLDFHKHEEHFACDTYFQIRIQKIDQ